MSMAVKPIPFHRHDFSEREVRAVTRVLKGEWITGGPENTVLEKEINALTKAEETVSVSSATSGLYLCLKLFGIGPGDDVITSPYSFVATANVIQFCGANVIFADIGPDYNLDPQSVSQKITPNTKAIIGVDYGGYPCDYPSLRRNSIPFRPTNLYQEALGRPLILADSAHSVGTVYRGSASGYSRHCADIHCYSFHAVKNITCGEGGCVSFMNQSLVGSGMATRMKEARLHGLSRDAYQRHQQKSFFYDVDELGYKFNLSEIAAALSRAQLKRISSFETKKKALKEFYDRSFRDLPGVKFRPENPLWTGWHIHPHLYTLEWEGLVPQEHIDEQGSQSQKKLYKKHHSKVAAVLAYKENFFRRALQSGLSLNFHYLPIPLLGYYRRRGYSLAQLPNTARVFPCHFSLPFYPSLSKTQTSKIVDVLRRMIGESRRRK